MATPVGTVQEGSNRVVKFGTNQGDWANAALLVGPTGSPIANSTYAEDTPHTTGDNGQFVLGVRNDALVVFTGTDGDYIPFGAATHGEMLVAPAQLSTLADGSTNICSLFVSNAGTSGKASAVLFDFNETTWDRHRGNVNGTALASAARTATAISSDITNYNSRGIIVFLNVTVASGTGGLVVQMQLKDPIGGLYKQVHANPTAITATGLQAYTFYPGNNNAGVQFNYFLSRTFAIQVQHNDASSYTYSVGYSLIV